MARVAVLLSVAHPELIRGEFEFEELSDELQYHQIAVAVAETGEYLRAPGQLPTASRLPMSTLPIAFLYWLFGPNPLLAVCYVILCSCLVVWMTGVLTYQLTRSGRARVLAMLVAAVLPSLLMTSAGVWSDPTAVLLVLTALYFVNQDRLGLGSSRIWLFGGLALSLSYLTRPATGILIALFAVFLASRFSEPMWIKRLLIFGTAVAMPILVWGIRNYFTLDEFFWGSSFQGRALLRANNPVAAGMALPVVDSYNGYDVKAEAERNMLVGRAVPLVYVLREVPKFGFGKGELVANKWFTNQVESFISENPGAIVRLAYFKTTRLVTAEPWAPSILGESLVRRRLRWIVAAVERAAVFPLGLVGLFLVLRRDPRLGATYAIVLISGLITVLISHPSARFLLPCTLTLVVLLAAAVDELLARRARPKATQATSTS